MTPTQRTALLAAVAATLGLPWVGSLLKWSGRIPGFGLFPPQRVLVPPGFNGTYFADAPRLARSCW